MGREMEGMTLGRGECAVKKTKINYWVDVCIGISFVLSAVSGLVFVLPVAPGANVLGIGYSIWSDLHTWSSVGMILGVAAHLVLHWRWILAMTKKMVLPEKLSRQKADSPAPGVTRRQVLSFGLATLFAGVVAIGCSTLLGDGLGIGSYDEADHSPQGDPDQSLQQKDTETSQSGESESPVQEGNDEPSEDVKEAGQQGDDSTAEAEEPLSQPSGVACPRGVVNDPFPGRCRHYVDSDNDGYCDYSIPGSGSY
jgi:hypothetical protein